jgi:hypothetical protein
MKGLTDRIRGFAEDVDLNIQGLTDETIVAAYQKFEGARLVNKCAPSEMYCLFILLLEKAKSDAVSEVVAMIQQGII